MTTPSSHKRSHRRARRNAALLEYGVLVAVIAVISITSTSQLETSFEEALGDITAIITGESGDEGLSDAGPTR